MKKSKIFKILTLIVVSCHALPAEKKDIVEGMKVSKSIDDNGLNETLRVEGDPALNAGYYEGDMVIRRTYNGAVKTALRWPNAVVHYKLNSVFNKNHVAQILEAMKMIESRSCVRFRPASAATKAFIHIKGDYGGCYSEVGYLGVEQILNLQIANINEGCFRIGHILHELLHALGFFHQHTAPERDKYIKVVSKNILKGKEINFRKNSDKTVNNFGVQYDYRSVMHYGAKTFSKNGKDTIIILKKAKDGNIQIGHWYHLSYGDFKKLNLMYNCKSV